MTKKKRRATGEKVASRGHTILNFDQVDEIRRLYASGTKQMALAARFGIGQSQISRIIRGKNRQIA